MQPPTIRAAMARDNPRVEFMSLLSASGIGSHRREHAPCAQDEAPGRGWPGEKCSNQIRRMVVRKDAGLWPGASGGWRGTSRATRSATAFIASSMTGRAWISG